VKLRSLLGAVAGIFVALGASVAMPSAAHATTTATEVCAFAPTSVAVVVDFGDARGMSTVCVPAGSTDSGAAVLGARAQQLGTPAPRFDQSTGLLCAIDGYPSSGCGEQNGSRYAYWSYWHGTSSGWTYSNLGPASSRVKSTVTEGWRFQPQGAGNPSDPAPRGSADPTDTCTPAPPPTTAPPAVAPAQATPGPAGPTTSGPSAA